MQALRALAGPPGRPRLLLAGAVLAGSIELFAWFGLGMARGQIADAASAIAERIRDDDAPLVRRLRKLTAPAAADAKGDPNQFLKRIDAAAAHAGVQLARLVPRPAKDGSVEVELAAAYDRLVGFVREIELSGAAVLETRLHAPEAGRTDPPAMVLALEPSGQPVAPANADRARAAAPARIEHDPFTRMKPPPPPIDLSAKHRLTGVTRLPGGNMATIDGRDYEKGDTLGPMLVEAVDDNEIALSAGEQRYVIHFKNGGGQ